MSAPTARHGDRPRDPVIGLETDLGEYLRKHEVLATAHLLEGWYVLANENLAVLIDAARPRIYALLAFGRFGTVQNLLYNVDYHELTHGLWGIIPAFRIAHKRFLPFNYHAGARFTAPELQSFANRAGEIRFDPAARRIELRRIACFLDDPNAAKRIVGIDLAVALDGDAIRIEADYPESLWTGELLTTLYPLYTHYRAGGARGRLVYYQDYRTLVNGRITLIDASCRMPRLTFESRHSAFRIHARADKDYAEAFRLNVLAEGASAHDEYVITVEPNPVTIRVNPYLNVGGDGRIAIHSDATPDAVTINGESTPARPAGPQGAAVVSTGTIKPGLNVVKVRCGDVCAHREVYALGDPADAIVRTAEALLKLQWTTPDLDGLFPFKYWMDPLEPCPEGTRVDSYVCASAICYMPRVFTNLISATLITGRRKYMDAVWRAIERIVAGSHEFDNGDLLSPDSYGQDGKPRRQEVRWYRPRYSIELAYHLALALARRGFLHLNDAERAAQALDYAVRYARTLLRLPTKDGGLYGLYVFPTLEVTDPATEGLGIEPGLRWVTRLADLIRDQGYAEDAGALDQFCRRAMAYFEDRILPCGTYASESAMHAPNHWVNLAGLLLERYVLAGTEEYAASVLEAAKLILLQSYMYIDQPDMYLMDDSAGSMFFADKGGFPKGLITKGDIADRENPPGPPDRSPAFRNEERRMKRLLTCTACILLPLLAGPAGAEAKREFFLRDGDVYVIYGCSITNNSHYARTIENYVLTRFPDWKVTFYNYAWHGDVAHNIDRLRRDVLPIKPTAFTECMGMNDGGYRTIHPDIVTRCMDAYRRMVAELRQANPDIRIALISAIPYENHRRRDRADGAYAQTLRVLSQVKRRMACELDVRYVDLFGGYAEKMGKGKVIYPDFVLSRNGVHPLRVGQTIIAQEILKGLGAPAEIASLHLRVADGSLTIVDSDRCRVRNERLSDTGEITFERFAEALPCPLAGLDDRDRRFLDAVDFSDEINRDILRIDGLNAPGYRLAIDGVEIGAFRTAELACGVNVAKPMKGPLWDQALAVATQTALRQYAHYQKWRTVLMGGRVSPWGGTYSRDRQADVETLDTMAARAVDRQHELNKPRWTTFRLSPVENVPLVLPEPVTYANSEPAVAPPGLRPLQWPKEKTRLVDLRPVVNRGFADEVAGDGRGGWSDQGPANDLRNLPTGRQVMEGMPFDVIDPADNGGDGMLVLSQRPGLGVDASAQAPINARAKTLVLLHAGAWCRNDAHLTLTINYADGSQSETPPAVGLHLADWWNAAPGLPRAVRAWAGRNTAGEHVGIYYAPIDNPTPKRKIESLTFSVPEDQSLAYGLIAITLLQ